MEHSLEVRVTELEKRMAVLEKEAQPKETIKKINKYFHRKSRPTKLNI